MKRTNKLNAISGMQYAGQSFQTAMTDPVEPSFKRLMKASPTYFIQGRVINDPLEQPHGQVPNVIITST